MRNSTRNEKENYPILMFSGSFMTLVDFEQKRSPRRISHKTRERADWALPGTGERRGTRGRRREKGRRSDMWNFRCVGSGLAGGRGGDSGSLTVVVIAVPPPTLGPPPPPAPSPLLSFFPNPTLPSGSPRCGCAGNNHFEIPAGSLL